MHIYTYIPISGASGYQFVHVWKSVQIYVCMYVCIYMHCTCEYGTGWCSREGAWLLIMCIRAMIKKNIHFQLLDKKRNDRCPVEIINSLVQMLLITNNHLLIDADLVCWQCFQENALFYLPSLYIFRVPLCMIRNFFFISLNTYFLTEVNIGFSYSKIVPFVFENWTGKSNSIFPVCVHSKKGLFE